MYVLCVIGTRPEAIKMAPVITELRRAGAKCIAYCTGQHDVRELLQHFEIEGAHHEEFPSDMVEILAGLRDLIQHVKFDAIIAQGDTLSVLAAAQTAFFSRTRFVHLEAGLRTYDLQAPFPEEYIRRCVAVGADLHCAPTENASDNLQSEGVPQESIAITGNTGIDALRWTLKKYGPGDESGYILITSHRLENREKQHEIVLAADVLRLRGLDVVYIQHPNPAARLDMPKGISCLSPQTYADMSWMLASCRMILTDSGGLQEEACYLGKPTVVLRDKTERPEAIAHGTAFIGGTTADGILEAYERALSAPRVARGKNCPFGDGYAAEKVVLALGALCG